MAVHKTVLCVEREQRGGSNAVLLFDVWLTILERARWEKADTGRADTHILYPVSAAPATMKKPKFQRISEILGGENTICGCSMQILCVPMPEKQGVPTSGRSALRFFLGSTKLLWL